MNRFNPSNYIPILRWKEAERTALAQLYGHDSKCITPLVELVAENFFRNDKNGHTIELSNNEVINKAAEQLFKCWGERPFFIDLWLLPKDILE